MPTSAVRAGVIDILDDACGAVQDLLLYSKKLGSDPFLVLHGGGNTSVKDDEHIRVKASGHDLGQLTAEGIPPLRRGDLDLLLESELLSDTEMVEGYKRARLDPGAPSPSIEALLHNLLPHRFVLHTHADAIVTLTNTIHGSELVYEALGDDILYLPFSMPGFDLAKLVQKAWGDLGDQPIRGIVLAHHGLFTFADIAHDAYQDHIEIVERASRFIKDRTGIEISKENPHVSNVGSLPVELTDFHSSCEQLAGFELAGQAVRSPEIDAFVRREDLSSITQRGPSTLEHVIHTKRVPLLSSDALNTYVQNYQMYFDTHAPNASEPLEMLDPVPRVLLSPIHGLVAVGSTLKRVLVARDIYQHTMRIINAAEILGGYQSISPAQAFDVEYWELEQAKLR